MISYGFLPCSFCSIPPPSHSLSLSLSLSVQNVSRTLLRASSTCHLRPLSSPISSSFPRICGQFGAVKPQTNRERTRHTAATVPSHFEKYPGKMIRPLLRWRSLYFFPFPTSIRLFPFSLPPHVRFSVSRVILRNPSSFLFSNVSSDLFLISIAPPVRETRVDSASSSSLSSSLSSSTRSVLIRGDCSVLREKKRWW